MTRSLILVLGLAATVTVGCQSPCCRHREAGPPPGVMVPRGPVAVAPNCPPGAGAPAIGTPGMAAPAFPGSAAPAPFPTAAPGPAVPGPAVPGQAAAPGAVAPGAPSFLTAPPAGAQSFPTAPPVPTLPPAGAPPGGAPPGGAPPGGAPPGGAPPGGAPPGNPPPSNAPPGPSGKIESNWQPAEARTPAPTIQDRVLLAPPEPVDRDSKSDSKGEPPLKEPPLKEPPLGNSDKKYYPAPSDNNVPSVPKLPGASATAAIPQFALVKPKVAAGLRPADGEGFDWLKANGYRTVVSIRLPGQQDGAREQAEKRGLKYVAVEIAPQQLTRESVEEFFRLMRDPQEQPVFVFDRDSALAGGLWYLWFRLSEELPDDVARIRARALGLREERDGLHREMWQAAQRYVESKN